MTLRLIYETHSITVDNETGHATGWLPGELSDAGIEAARQLGERRRDQDVAAVFTSDLRRAVQTAEIAFGDTNIPVYETWLLRECNYGDWNGMPVAQLHEERPKHIRQPFPSGESYEDVVERTRRFLREAFDRYDTRTIVVISHSANRWALDLLLYGKPLEKSVVAPFDWKPGWIYEIGSRPEDRRND